jgi:predicted dehydrogenase
MNNAKQFGVGIVGCGLIGSKRAAALGAQGKLIACADINFDSAKKLASTFGADCTSDWHELIGRKDIDIVIICTLHDSLVEITAASIQSGKHVLVEKPAARSADEIKPLVELAKRSKVSVRVGFNHRYHRAFQKARRMVDDGEIGELMFIRARYGHGGRLGYDREWRADPLLSGGGELIDQGPHLIDLSRWFLGNFTEVSGFAHTYYWDMSVDDNAFMTLTTPSTKVAHLHVSCTEWKNIFSMEIYGKGGKLEISGLGGSYGLEKLTFYKMLPEMGPPETFSWEYPMHDNSWAVEMEDFYNDIRSNKQPSVGLHDAYEVLKIIEKVYRNSGYDHSA